MVAESVAFTVTPRRRLLNALSLPVLASAAAVSPVAPIPAHASFADATRRIIATRESPFGRIAVTDAGRFRYLTFGPDNRRVYQSMLDLDRPEALAAPYTRLMMLGLVYANARARIVQIGVGAGNMTGYAIRTFPQVTVDAIDIDGTVLELAQQYFGLRPDPRLRLHVADGRSWLRDTAGRFDVVMLDAYDDRTIPPHLSEAAFFRLVADRLAPGGVVMQNVYTRQVDTREVTAAMRASFDQVDAYRSGSSVVLAGYQGPRRDPSALRAQARRLDAALRPVHPLEDLLGSAQ